MVERTKGRTAERLKIKLKKIKKKKKKKKRKNAAPFSHSLSASSTEQVQPGRAAPLSVSQGGMHCNDTAEQSATTRLGSGRVDNISTAKTFPTSFATNQFMDASSSKISHGLFKPIMVPLPSPI